LAFTADGRILAAADYETGTLRFYDVSSWKPLVSVQSEVGPVVWSIAFSPDGRHFAAGGSSGLQLWRVRHDPRATGAGSSFALEPVARLSNEASRSTSFSPDSRLLAWAEGLIQSNHRIRLWDVQAAQPLTAPTSSPLRSLMALGISPDGKRLAFVSSKPAIEVWDMASGRQAFSFGEGELQRRGALPPHTRLSGDGAWYAIGGRVPTIWNLENKNLLLALPGEQSAVWCVGWSPDKEQLAVGTADGGLVLWNLPRIKKHLAEIGLDW
jgi:WD40 repeat protein